MQIAENELRDTLTHKILTTCDLNKRFRNFIIHLSTIRPGQTLTDKKKFWNDFGESLIDSKLLYPLQRDEKYIYSSKLINQERDPSR